MEITIDNIESKPSYVWFTLPIDYDKYLTEYSSKLKDVYHEIIIDEVYGRVITFPEDFINDVCSVIMKDSNLRFTLTESGTRRDNILHLIKVAGGEIKRKENVVEKVEEVEDKENETSKMGNNIIKISRSQNFRNKENVKKVLEKYKDILDCNITVHYCAGSRKDYKNFPKDTLHIFLWSFPTDIPCSGTDLGYIITPSTGNRRFALNRTRVLYGSDGSNITEGRHLTTTDHFKIVYIKDNNIYFTFDIDGMSSSDFHDLFDSLIKDVLIKYHSSNFKPDVLKHIDIASYVRKLILEQIGFSSEIDFKTFNNFFKQIIKNDLSREELNLRDHTSYKNNQMEQLFEIIKTINETKKQIEFLKREIEDENYNQIQKQLEKIKNNKMVEDVGISRDNKYLLIKTKNIVTYKLSDGTQRDIGEIIIKIPIEYRKDPNIRIENLTRLCGVPAVPFPHFETGTQSLCLGNYSVTLADILGSSQFDVATDIIIEFLQTINEKDPYGERYRFWPIYDPSSKEEIKEEVSKSVEPAAPINTIISQVTTNNSICEDCGNDIDECTCNICEDCGNHYDDCTCNQCSGCDNDFDHCTCEQES